MMVTEMLSGHRVLALDLETTGVSTNSDRIVQIALLGSMENDSPITWEALVNPQRPIPPGASAVHGIMDSDVREQPLFSAFSQKIFDLIDGAVIVGHNVRRFDLPLLDKEFLRCGKIPPSPKVVIDTLELVRRLKIARPHRLSAQCQRYGIDLRNAHDAAADAAASLLLLWKLMQENPAPFRRSIEDVESWLMHGDVRDDASELGRGMDDLETLDPLGRIRIDGEGLVLSFGRHRGKDVSQIIDEDSGYIDWLLSPNGIEDEQAREKLKEYISSIRNR